MCQGEIDMEEDEKRKTLEREKLEDFGSTFLGKLRKQLWNLFEYPHTSRGAQVGCRSNGLIDQTEGFINQSLDTG